MGVLCSVPVEFYISLCSLFMENGSECFTIAIVYDYWLVM